MTAPRPAPAVQPVGHSPRALLETALLTLAVPFLGWVTDPTDPFLLHRSFSWLLLAPLLLGIRHGLVLGLASAVALDCGLVFAWQGHAFGVSALPGETLVGLVAASMIAGQSSNVWTRERHDLLARTEALQAQLEALARAYVVLELSHDRLRDERREDANLRDALESLAASPGPEDSRSKRLDGALMDLLVRYCAVDIASLHAIGRDGTVRAMPLAIIGRPEPVQSSDPLLCASIATSKLTHVALAEFSGERASSSHLLAAVPLTEATGVLRAVLCIQSMPFMAFHRGNLEAIAALGGTWADLTRAPAAFKPGERAREIYSKVVRASAAHEGDAP